MIAGLRALVSIVLAAAPATDGPVPFAPLAVPAPVYRLYHDGTKEHLYTTDLNEYIVLGGRGWLQEGIAFQLLDSSGSFEGVGLLPYFRLYHPFILQHHWTSDANERAALETRGWSFEGVTGYVLASPSSSSVPLFRLALPSPPLHLWTTDAHEYATLPARGWIGEGVSAHVLPPDFGAPTGACCAPVARSCSEGTAASCAAACGVYAGDGTTCAGGTCTAGACCTAGSCAASTESACTSGGGRFLGYWTACGSGSCGLAPVGGTPPLRLAQVAPAGTFTRPLHLAAPPGDVARLFVVEKAGRIRILRGGSVLPTPFLDLTTRVLSSGGEQGLYALAFHPDYLRNGRFYVHYTAAGGGPSGHAVIEEFRVSASNPDVADPASGVVLLTQDDPYDNHNGGQIAFGPQDRYLYIALGDGGSGGDPQNRAQDLTTLWGKLLRIDVNCATPPLAYSIPPSNPFLGVAGSRGEVFAYGLRNPYRVAFDRNGDLYIGDVGQGCWEEVDAVTSAAAASGLNFGWRRLEGHHCFNGNCASTQLCGAGCAAAPTCAPYTAPVIEYNHAGSRCSVTGGQVYRGARLPGYAGTYFYSDYCSGQTWSFVLAGGAATAQQERTSSFPQIANPTSYGVDASGEVYILNDGGSIWRNLGLDGRARHGLRAS